MSTYRIRLAKIEDADRLLEIYAPYVRDTSITFEYDVPSLEAFEKRIESTLMFYPYLVCECDKEVIGYAYASPFKGRIAYQYSCEVSIYVDKKMCNRGVGTALYEGLEKVLKHQNIQNLNACITYPNEQSILFHERCGYTLNAHFHKCGYKFNTWYDMVWMEKFIGNHEDYPKPLKGIKEINLEDIL